VRTGRCIEASLVALWRQGLRQSIFLG
jgi:hypothetical protein